MRNTRLYSLLSVSLTAFALSLPAAAQAQDKATVTSRIAAGRGGREESHEEGAEEATGRGSD